MGDSEDVPPKQREAFWHNSPQVESFSLMLCRTSTVCPLSGQKYAYVGMMCSFLGAKNALFLVGSPVGSRWRFLGCGFLVGFLGRFLFGRLSLVGIVGVVCVVGIGLRISASPRGNGGKVESEKSQECQSSPRLFAHEP